MGIYVIKAKECDILKNITLLWENRVDLHPYKIF